jgi:hypothetical protein
MTALNSILGRPGESVQCKSIGEVSIHWWSSMDAKPGDLCLCGEMAKPIEEPDQ